MTTDMYRFQVGDFQCVAVSDGTHTYAPPTFPLPAIFLFTNAPRERLIETTKSIESQLLDNNSKQQDNFFTQKVSRPIA